MVRTLKPHTPSEHALTSEDVIQLRRAALGLHSEPCRSARLVAGALSGVYCPKSMQAAAEQDARTLAEAVESKRRLDEQARRSLEAASREKERAAALSRLRADADRAVRWQSHADFFHL
jgi:hypothetical protein